MIYIYTKRTKYIMLIIICRVMLNDELLRPYYIYILRFMNLHQAKKRSHICDSRYNI